MMRAARATLLSIFVLFAGTSLRVLAQAPADPAEAAAMAAIDEVTMKKHIKIVAADDMQGRDTGSVGHNKAADYIRTQWKEAGVKSLAEDGSYYQPWLLRSSTPDYETSGLNWRKGSKKGTFKGGGNREDERTFEVFPFSGSGAANGAVVFVGYGITAKEYDYDDYAQMDVKGKIVLCFRHEPRELEDSGWNGKTNTKHASFEEKYKNAKEHGAAGFICITDPENHKEKDRRPGRQRYDMQPAEPTEKGKASKEIPAIWLDFDAAATMVGSAKILSDWQKEIDEKLAPKSTAINNLNATLTVKISHKDLSTQNICGYIPGSDEKLAEEFVVLGAHSDHVGLAPSGKDKIFNGADDNGSGTTTLITVAQALARAGVKPKRTIIFLSFAGEEKGLLGAEYYVAHPLRPLEQTIAMLNMDMVGRNFDNGCEVIGTQFSPALRNLIDGEGKVEKLQLEFKPGTDSQNVLERSDQAPFFKRQIPVAFFTTGLHKDYHQVSDHWDLIKCDNMAKVGRLIARTTLRLANAQEKPAFVPQD